MPPSIVTTDESKGEVPMTPTSTACNDEQSITNSATQFNESVAPRAGKTYMIRHRTTGCYFCVQYGELELDNQPDGVFGYRWSCEEMGGWMVFQELVSGRWLSSGTYSSDFTLNMDPGDDDQFQVVLHEWDEKFDGPELGKRGAEFHLTILDEKCKLLRVGVCSRTPFLTNHLKEAALGTSMRFQTTKMEGDEETYEQMDSCTEKKRRGAEELPVAGQNRTAAPIDV